MTAQLAPARDMVVSLIEGIDESPPFASFLRDLVARTQARRAVLVIGLASAAPDQAPTVVHAAAPRAVGEPDIDVARLATLDLHRYGALRPGRVYAIDEMLDFDDPAALARQRGALDAMGIRYGRWLRAAAGGIADASILLAREREDFSSSAVSALSATATPLSAALRMFAALSAQRLQAELAQSALRKLGIGQIALDQSGRVMAADPLAAELLTFSEAPDGAASRRLQLPVAAQADLEAACRALARAQAGPVGPVTIPVGSGVWLLLTRWDPPLPEGSAQPAVIGTLRRWEREDERRGALVLRQLHVLSDNEAALAEKLSRGLSIVEAGRQLRLTAETARNYSKRLYAKTGTRGQADLVRTILASLAPLA